MGGLLSNVLGSIVKPVIRDEGKELIQKAIAPMETEFKKSKAGTYLMGMLKDDFAPTYKKTVETLTQQARSTYGPMPDAGTIASQAKNIARVSTFGRNDANAVALIKAAHNEKGLVHAQNLADRMAMYLHDTTREVTSKAGTTRDISSFKSNVARSAGNSVPLDTSPVYKHHTELENYLQSYAATILAPAIAIPHMQNFMNLAISTPLKSLAKGLADVMTPGGYKASKDALLHTGIFADTTLTAYKEMLEFRSGKVAQLTNPDVGYWLNKIVHAPGFHAVRDWTLAAAGATAKHTLEDMTRDLVNTGSKRAALELREMGIDPVKLVATKGVLTPDEYEKAIFHFVDKKVFLDTKLSRSYFAQSSPMFRVGTMFHGFVTMQGRLLKGELMKAYKSKDLGLIAQTMAVLGIAFPVVGEAINQVERLARGQDIDPGKDFGKLSGEEGGEAMAEQWLDAMSHTAGFGIWTSFVRGATRSHLANTFLGPVGNVAVGAVEHAGALAFQEKHPWKPLARDVLTDTLPVNLGKILSHRMLPTTKEELERHPKHGLKRLKRRK